MILTISTTTAPNRRWQFRLGTLLLLMIPLAAGFAWLRDYRNTRPLEWAPYSAQRLQQELDAGRTVLVYLNPCGAYHIETSALRRWMWTHGIVALRADFSSGFDETRAAINSLSWNVLPSVAIYPAGSPKKPIVLQGWLTEEELLQALQQASESRNDALTTQPKTAAGG